MIDMRRLSDDLTEAFIWYQHRLDNPFPPFTETKAMVTAKYMNDPIFHGKVQSMVAGVMAIVSRNVATEEEAAQPALEVDVLVEALEEISDPIRFMNERLEEGKRLNGMATVTLANAAWYLRSIATAALTTYRKGEEV